MLKILDEYPPNINEIRQYLNPPENAVFCYGETIYNPSGQKVPEDIIWHENVHSNQQKTYTSPSVWWTKYLLSKEYRLECELEAYSAQYLWLKERLPNKAMKEVLDEMAENLELHYELGYNVWELATMLRHHIK